MNGVSLHICWNAIKLSIYRMERSNAVRYVDKDSVFQTALSPSTIERQSIFMNYLKKNNVRCLRVSLVIFTSTRTHFDHNSGFSFPLSLAFPLLSFYTYLAQHNYITFELNHLTNHSITVWKFHFVRVHLTLRTSHTQFWKSHYSSIQRNKFDGNPVVSWYRFGFFIRFLSSFVCDNFFVVDDFSCVQ